MQLSMYTYYNTIHHITQPSKIRTSLLSAPFCIHKGDIYAMYSYAGELLIKYLNQATGSKLYKEIHKLIVLIWNKEELPQEWKGSIIVPIHKKGDRMDCNNYRNFSLVYFI